MKKILSMMLSLAMIMASVTAVCAAAVTELSDGFDNEDYSKMVSYSDGLIFETKKLGTYENASYVTSAQNVSMELVYNLNDMASFEVITLNYKDSENISFYVSEAADGEYTEVNNYTTDITALNTSWDKMTYTASGLKANYLKIVIEQTAGGKYIRLDNVKMYADFELKIEDCRLTRDGSKLENNNIYAADTLTLEFNQKVNIPTLILTTEGRDAVYVEGQYGESTNVITYTFDPLEFRIYSFEIKDITTTTGRTMDFSKTLGYSVISGIPEYIHFGDNYNVADFVKEIRDSDGNIYSPEDISISIEDEKVIKLEEGKLIPIGSGRTNATIEIQFNGEMVKLTKILVLCGVKSMGITPTSVSLSKGESKKVTAEVVLEDDTVTQPQKLTLVSSDETIIKVSGDTITAMEKGNAFLEVKAEYYGFTEEKTISVGVDKEILASIATAQISMNETNIVVNSSAETVIKGFSSDGNEMDMVAAESTYYSDNSDVVEISDNGRIYAKGIGEANVSAIVDMGGVKVSTNSLHITVIQDYLYKAELIATNLYMLPGMEMPLGVKAYTSMGTQIENGLNVSYYCDDTAVAEIRGGSLIAKAMGVGRVYATISYNGKTVNTPTYEVKILENTGSMTKNFKVSKNWDGTISHSDGLSIDADGLKLSSGENQSVVFSPNNTINKIELNGISYGTPADGDIKLYISYGENADTDYEEIPIEISAMGAGKVSISGKNTELYENVKYLRLSINGNSVRIESIKTDYNVAPEVLGVTAVTSDYVPILNSAADKLLIRFSQDIDEKTLTDGILLKEKGSGKKIDIGEVALVDGIYEISPNLTSTKSYVLEIFNIKNSTGMVMSDSFACELTPPVKSIVAQNAMIDNSGIKANIINSLQTSITADIVSVIYDAEGYMTGIHIERDYTINTGQNLYSVSGSYQGETVSIYVWNYAN